MARRHKPALLKLIDGSKRLSLRPEPEPEGNLSAPPAWLTPSQADCRRYAIQNAPLGLLRLIDASVLTIFAHCPGSAPTGRRKIAQHGQLIRLPIPACRCKARTWAFSTEALPC